MRTDVAGALFFVAALYVLARPGSKAVDLIDAVSKGLIALVRRAADLGGTA